MSWLSRSGAFVEPQDIRSFALVSRRMNQLSSSFVEHALFRKLFSEVRIRPGSKNGRAAELFRGSALVSRRIHHLSLPYVDEHAFFRMLLSRIRISPTGRSADLFSQIFQDSRAKFYLQDFQTEKWPYPWRFPRYCRPLRATIADLKRAFEVCPLPGYGAGEENTRG